MDNTPSNLRADVNALTIAFLVLKKKLETELGIEIDADTRARALDKAAQIHEQYLRETDQNPLYSLEELLVTLKALLES